jgi:hypothetical protein
MHVGAQIGMWHALADCVVQCAVLEQHSSGGWGSIDPGRRRRQRSYHLWQHSQWEPSDWWEGRLCGPDTDQDVLRGLFCEGCQVQLQRQFSRWVSNLAGTTR